MVSSSQPAGKTVPRLGRRLVNHVKRSVAPSRLGRFYRLRRRSHVPSQRLDRVADNPVKDGHRARPDAAGEADQAVGRPSQAPGRERVLRCWLDHEAVARRRAAHRRSHRQPDSRRHSSGAHCPVGLTEPAVRGKKVPGSIPVGPRRRPHLPRRRTRRGRLEFAFQGRLDDRTANKRSGILLAVPQNRGCLSPTQHAPAMWQFALRVLEPPSGTLQSTKRPRLSPGRTRHPCRDFACVPFPTPISPASSTATCGLAADPLPRGDPLVDLLRRPPHGARAQADGGREIVSVDEAIDRRSRKSGAFHDRGHAQHPPVDGHAAVPSIGPVLVLARMSRQCARVIVSHGRYLPVRNLDKSSSKRSQRLVIAPRHR